MCGPRCVYNVYIGFPLCIYNVFKHILCGPYNIIVFYARDNNDSDIIITVHGVGGLKRLYIFYYIATAASAAHLLHLKADARKVYNNKQC